MVSPKSTSRRRPSIVEQIEADPRHHLTGSFLANGDVLTPPVTPFEPEQSFQNGTVQGVEPKKRKRLPPEVIPMTWMTNPATSLKGVVIPLIGWAIWELLASIFGGTALKYPNPFAALLFISYPVEDPSAGTTTYHKGYKDLVFIAYYVVVLSFVRETVTTYLFKPFARRCGIRSSRKIDRFGEQAYALMYFGSAGIYGLIVMRGLPTWWYQTQYFWIDYPHWQMNAGLKRYYLMQTSNWLHQFLVLALRLEKPRSDFVELILHHIVTLWLIGWSYLINLSYIGNSVFVSMDIPDAIFALAKLLVYVDSPLNKVVFPTFVVAWSYFRHYLNLRIIKSTWDQFHLMPESSKQWNPPTGVWMADWMQYQVIAPLILLQMVNLFWYFLIWRVFIRSIMNSVLTDERSDDEDEKED